MLSLDKLKKGEKAEIIEFIVLHIPPYIRQHASLKDSREKQHCSANKFITRLQAMGFRRGKLIEMVSNNGNGPVLVKINDQRIALGRGMAMKVKVRLLENK